MGLHEIQAVGDVINELADPSAQCFFGAVTDERWVRQGDNSMERSLPHHTCFLAGWQHHAAVNCTSGSDSMQFCIICLCKNVRIVH